MWGGVIACGEVAGGVRVDVGGLGDGAGGLGAPRSEPRYHQRPSLTGNLIQPPSFIIRAADTSIIEILDSVTSAQVFVAEIAKTQVPRPGRC
ncbi:MAG TPA: hypothetical protein DEG43_11965 [Acidimicrobiaceae bacterium]|nr:hypothetical protein [Acidimicrobiaceae bacterium]